MKGGVEELEATFANRPDLVFRHYPDCITCMRWQAGRNVADIADLPDGRGLLVERFELLWWASTAEALIDKLSAL